MKKIYLIIAACFAVSTVNSQVIYTEEFDNGLAGMAGAWTVEDVDGATINANVTAIFGATGSWVSRTNLGATGDSVAMSTSWMDPVTATDDWLMSPSIALTTGNIISWSELATDAAYADGYEMYITTAIAGANPTSADFTGANGAMLYSVANASNPETTQTVDLDALGYSSQNVWFAWRNNSTDQYVLEIDAIVVETPVPFDVSMAAVNNAEYTLTPLPQVTTNIGTDGVITNLGGSAVTNAVMTVNGYDGSLANVYTATSTPVASIAAGANAAVNVPGYLPTAADNYIVEMISSMTEVDADQTNDTAYYGFTVTDTVYARDNGQIAGALGIGAGNGGELGQLFTLAAADDLSSISAYINGSNMDGSRLSAIVYDVVNGTPTTILALTDTIILPAIDDLYTLTFPCGSVNITSDSIAVMIHEHVGDSTLALATTNDIFTTGTTYLNWPTIPTFPYDNNESFGQNVSYVIRPNFGAPVMPTIDNSVTALADSITATENGAGVTYQWIDCNNANAIIAGADAQTYTATANGDYAVIVSNACLTDTSACTNIVVTSINDVNSSEALTVSPNPSNGLFTLSFNGAKATNLNVEVLDITGKVVMTKSVKNLSNAITVDMTVFNAGTYFIKASNEEFNVTERFVILK
jgi:hypothetical protein